MKENLLVRISFYLIILISIFGGAKWYFDEEYKKEVNFVYDKYLLNSERADVVYPGSINELEKKRNRMKNKANFDRWKFRYSRYAMEYTEENGVWNKKFCENNDQVKYIQRRGETELYKEEIKMWIKACINKDIEFVRDIFNNLQEKYDLADIPENFLLNPYVAFEAFNYNVHKLEMSLLESHNEKVLKKVRKMELSINHHSM